MTPEGVTCARLRLAHVTPSGVTSKNTHTLYTITLWLTMNDINTNVINRNHLLLGTFKSNHYYSERFYSVMSNLKTLGSLMMFPGTITRPPPPFTSTITRLSSRSLSCQVLACTWSALQTCRHSLIRWPNFRSMFQRWSCCQEFPEHFMKTGLQ